MPKWKYKNATANTVYWDGVIWTPSDECETNAPVPAELGLTCTQTGDTPNPILLHEDFVLQDGEEREIALPRPKLSRNLALTILNLADGGATCRFNSPDNAPIPLDVRGFVETLPWAMCAKLFFVNNSGDEAQISVSAVEVIE